MLSRLWLGLCLVLVLLSSALTWQVQAWRYGRLFAQQAEAQAHEAQARAEEAARALLAEREGRQQLEQRLQGSETRHFQELAHAQQTQARLRDRLATADLRLSVLVEQGANCPAVPAPPAPAAWIMAPYAPDLTQRMLDALSPSPTPETGD